MTSTTKKVGGVFCALLLVLGVFQLVASDGGSDPLVGPLWSSGVFRETGQGVYRVWESADFKGGDLAFTQAKSIDECLYACDDNQECLYVSFLDGICYIKDTPMVFESFDSRPSLFAAKRVRVKPVVGEHWHSGKPIETTKTLYRVWDEATFNGPDSETLNQPDLDSCLRQCDNSPQCMFVSFDGRGCQLKKDSKLVNKIVVKAGSKAAMKMRTKDLPDPLVKHHWSKGGQKETKDSLYQTWNGCQFVGDTIHTVKADSLAACLRECDAELFCRHITLVDKECHLKGWAPEYFEVLPERSDVWAAKLIERKQQKTPALGKQDEQRDLHQDGLVGQFYDEAVTIETKFNRYRVWGGFDFTGGDLHSSSLTLDSYSLESCLLACDQKPECRHVVSVEGKECWLKAQPDKLLRLTGHSDMHAAMRLGRVGKSGIDALTTDRRVHKPNRNQALSAFMSKSSFAYGRGLITYYPPNVVLLDSALLPESRTLLMTLLLLVILGGTLGGVVFYWHRIRAGFYVNELS